MQASGLSITWCRALVVLLHSMYSHKRYFLGCGAGSWLFNGCDHAAAKLGPCVQIGVKCAARDLADGTARLGPRLLTSTIVGPASSRKRRKWQGAGEWESSLTHSMQDQGSDAASGSAWDAVLGVDAKDAKRWTAMLGVGRRQ